MHPIYLDYNSTTPVDPRVADAITESFREHFGNPHSEHHFHGRQAAEALQAAKTHAAKLIGTVPESLLLTSGATEANNLALSGLANWLKQQGKTKFVTTTVEHSSVLEPMKRLSEEGFTIEYLPVQSDGTLDFDILKDVLSPDVGLCSVMAANNEIGTLYPLTEIAVLCKQHGVLFHSDLSQYLASFSLDIDQVGLDLASFSAHKLYGPSGIGALFVRPKLLRKMRPLILGGDQQYKVRPGTVALHLAVGLGEACRIAKEEYFADTQRIRAMRDSLLSGLQERIKGMTINGTMKHRLPGNLNLSFEGIDAEALLMGIRELVSISSGSACHSHSIEPSHVIQALGIPEEQAEGAVRLSVGRFTTEEDVQSAIEAFVEVIGSLRRISGNTWSKGDMVSQ